VSCRGPDPDAFAALLCDWCLEVQEGQQVLVNTTTLAEPAVRALHRGLLQRGAWPLLRVAPPYLTEDFYRFAGDAQLDRFAPLDRDDPLAAWRELSDRQQRLVERLSGAREIHIEAERTDLRLRVDGRTWINSDGRRNMPSGSGSIGRPERSCSTRRSPAPSTSRSDAPTQRPGARTPRRCTGI
jgi:leucyl aminopeptidase (aminopeptidase T)